jgi:hypothetical protein
MFDPIVIVLLFAAAWLLARAAGFVALKVLVWNDRRVAETDLTQSGRMRRLKRRETQVSIIRPVAPGREWLVDGFFADLLRERAEPGLIAQGP